MFSSSFDIVIIPQHEYLVNLLLTINSLPCVVFG